MPLDNTPLLSLPLLAHKQALQTTFHDDAIKTLDALVMLSVIDRDLSSPPVSPDEGDRYIVSAPGSGDPAWIDDHVVVFVDGNWRAHEPQPGWTCYVQDEGVLIAWDGAVWQPALQLFGGGTAQNLDLLGVGTEADATNPVSFVLNNVLCAALPVAEGGDGDLRYKLSKEAAANTLSLLLQNNFSGRAEIGLTGDDDFHVRVSPDGTTWHDGIVIDKDTGEVAFPHTPGLGSSGIARRSNVLTPHEGLVCRYAGAATVDIDADAVVLFDASGTAKRFTALDETLDITASGANGLDSGSEAANTWYHIWAIGKADGTLDGLLSASASAPTLPSGYTFKGYLGAVRNNGSSDFVSFIQRGNLLQSLNQSVLANGTATSYTAIDLSAGVPPTATAVYLRADYSTSSGTAEVVVFLAPAGSGTTATYAARVVSRPDQGTNVTRSEITPIVMDTPQQVVYRVAGTNAQVNVTVDGCIY